MSCATKEGMLSPSGDSSSNDFVRLTVVTEGSDVGCDRAFPARLTVGQLRERLEILTGANSSSMQLELHSQEGSKLVSKLEDDNAQLGSCVIPKHGLILKVIDPKLDMTEFTDTSRIEKLTISDDKYDQMDNTARAYLKRQGLGRFSNQTQALKKADINIEAKLNPQKVTECDIGSRCEVRVKGQLPKRGVVVFVGETDFKAGTWVGIKYDEPVGKNDGSVAGRRYFQCEPNYGGFVRPQDVFVGDYPELGYDSQSQSSDDRPEEI